MSGSSALLMFLFALNHSADATVMFRCYKAGQIQPEIKGSKVPLEVHFLGGGRFQFYIIDWGEISDSV